jgi:hypothetical protein
LGKIIQIQLELGGKHLKFNWNLGGNTSNSTGTWSKLRQIQLELGRNHAKFNWNLGEHKPSALASPCKTSTPVFAVKQF